MDGRRVNWFGLAGGSLTIFLVIESLVFANPWWQLTVGRDFLHVVTSPLKTNFSFLGMLIVIPIIWVLNLTCLLSLTASGIVMLIYSFVPTRNYSKHLLSFAYKKPLFTLLAFVVSLFVVTYAANALLQFNIPLNGSTKATLPTSVTKGASINVPIAAEFTWVFWLAIIGAILCIAARIYHRQIVSTSAAGAPPSES
jgi:hypothetical protein